MALPLLLMMLFVVLDLASLFDQQARLQAVAREAARAGALGGVAACRQAGRDALALRFADAGLGAVECSEAGGAVTARVQYRAVVLSPLTRLAGVVRGPEAVLAAVAQFRRQ